MPFHLPSGYRENPQFSADDVGGGYWDEDKVTAKGARWQAAVYRLVAEIAKPGDTVLDIGCGNGLKLRRIVAPAVTRAVGIDQPSGIEMARKVNDGGEWIAGDLGADATWQDLTQMRADIVVCSDVIEHLDDPLQLLGRLAAVAAHGRLVLSTPDRGVLYGSDHEGPPRNVHHIREWTAPEMRALITGAGLTVVDVRHVRARDFYPPVDEAKRWVASLLKGKRPAGMKRSCMVFVCEPHR